MSVGDMGEMLLSSTLLGLPVLSSGQSTIRGSMIPSTVQGMLGLLTLSMTVNTSMTWLHLGTEPFLSQRPQFTLGVYVGRGTRQYPPNWQNRFDI